MNKSILSWAAITGALSVALGAFAAHGLRAVFPPDAISIFETGVRYQFYHVFALIAAALFLERAPSNRRYVWAARFFGAGILLFSGSLYVLAAVKAGKLALPESIGLITPVGGLCFIGGWLLLLSGSMKK